MQTRSYSRYILTVLCIAITFTALVLIALNAWIKQPSTGASIGYVPSRASLTKDEELKEAYVQGYVAARERLSSLGGVGLNTEPRILRGTVVNVGSKSLTLKQTNLDTHPLVDSIPDERLVTLAANAHIYAETEKTTAQFQAELADFEKSSLDNPERTPPQIFTRREITLSDIPVGASLRIISEESVRMASEIIASEIVYRLPSNER